MYGKLFELDQIKLAEHLYEHRKKQKLSRYDVAGLLGISKRTYERWESSGKSLTNISSLLKVFQVLGFSTPEIIAVLHLPPLKLDEVKALYQDEDTLKDIKASKIYSVMREKSPDMDVFTLGKLLELLSTENMKRLKSGPEKK